MNNFITRTLTGFALVVFIILLIAAGWPGFLLLVALIDAIGLVEFYHLSNIEDIKLLKTTGISLSLFFLACTYGALAYKNYYLLAQMLPAMFIPFALALYQKKKDPLPNLWVIVTGWACITLPLCLLLAVGCYRLPGHYDSGLLLGYFMLLWAGDSGAYLTGKLFGRHPLFKRISPRKTWEGSAGGAIFTLTVGWVDSYWFTGLSAGQWFMVAVIVMIAGTYGDLFKSLLKRRARVKDSGHLLPGHGGVLDRFDSLLGSAPFVFWFLTVSK